MESQTAPTTTANAELIARLVIPVILAVCIVAVWVGLVSLQDQTKVLSQRLAAAEMAAGKSNDRVTALEKANADAESENKALQARVAEAAAAAAKGADSVAALTTTLNTAEAQSKTLSDTVAAQARSITDVEDRANRVDRQLDANQLSHRSLESRVYAAETSLAATSASVAKLTADEDAVKSTVASVRGAVAWRSLSGDTQAALTKEMAKTTSAAVDIAYLTGDTESHAYAMQIGKAFKAAGWDVGYSQADYPGSMITGVIVDAGDDSATTAVLTAFKATGVDFLAAKLPEAAQTMGEGRREGAAAVLVGSHAVRF